MVQTVYGSKGEGRISIAKRGLRLRGPWRGPAACPIYARADGGGSRLMYAVSGTVQSSSGNETTDGSPKEPRWSSDFILARHLTPAK
jgi:hypothetical protein